MKAQRQLIRRRKFVVVDTLASGSSGGMAWYCVVGVLLVFLSAGCDSSSSNEGEQMATTTFYEGYEDDIKVMRQTTRSSPSGQRRSSGEAIEAAERVFANIDFVGMSKQEVLAVLGDPGEISDRGVPDGHVPDGPLIYCFDNGLDGVQFTLTFKNGEVASVQMLGLD